MFQRNGFVREKNSLRREKMRVCCMGSKQKLEVLILKHSLSSCLMPLSWSPGVVQHPHVSPVSLWNNNTLSRFFYPYLSRKSLCRELLLAGKVSAQLSWWDHRELPLGFAGIPGCLSGREQRIAPFLLFFVQIGQVIILLHILIKNRGSI